MFEFFMVIVVAAIGSLLSFLFSYLVKQEARQIKKQSPLDMDSKYHVELKTVDGAILHSVVFKSQTYHNYSVSAMQRAGVYIENGFKKGFFLVDGVAISSLRIESAVRKKC